jgi:exodeoxyribonuclease V alpha subunit
MKKIKLIKTIFESNNYAVFLGDDENIYQTELGHKADELINTPLKVEIKEVFNKKYGKQYKILKYDILESPLSFFLRRVAKTGLPRETIYKIDKMFSLKEFKEIIEINPHRLLEIKNIGKIRLKKLIEEFNKNSHLVELAEVLNEMSISSSYFQDVFNLLKKEALTPSDLKENPYLLTKIEGIGFLKADKIALNYGIDKYSIKRISAYISYYIEYATYNKGDTLFNKEDIFIEMVKELELEEDKAKEVFEEALISLIKKEEIVKVSLDDVYFEKKSFYMMEEYIKEIIEKYDEMRYWNNEIKKEELINYTFNKDIKFSPKQKEAIENFATSSAPFFILAGYAGAGKTTVSKIIMDIYADIWGKENIVACALSGNASNRIKNVTGYNAFTIHSLLRYKGKGFEFNEENKLPFKLIVLDEASMVDIFLFYHLLKAIDFSYTKLFIIGDNAQLPPVGAGEVFSNMLEIDKIEKVILDKVFRQKENQVINIFAQDVRKGKVPKGYKKRDYEDFFFITVEIDNYFARVRNLKDKDKKKVRDEVNTKIVEKINKLSKKVDTNVLSMLLNGLKRILTEDFKKFKEYAYRYIYYYQIIAPQKNGIVGTVELNRITKSIFNPTEKIFSRSDIGLWDKIIHLKNKNKTAVSLEEFFEIKKTFDELSSEEKYKTYIKLINPESSNENMKRVFNGQVGIVIDKIVFIDDNDELVKFIAVYYPSEDYVVFYNESEANNRIIDLSYSFTVHKSQGSEYNVVAIPISLSNAFMLNNKLLYTAITRAKKKLYLFGESYAFEMGVRKRDEVKRVTFLSKYFENNML